MRETGYAHIYREASNLSADDGFGSDETEGWGGKDAWMDDDLWIEESPWSDNNLRETLALKYLGSRAILRS